MKFAVDLQTCQNMGQCSFTAPELFELDDDGALAFRRVAETEYVSGEVSAEEADLAESAATLCPMQAIRILQE